MTDLQPSPPRQPSETVDPPKKERRRIAVSRRRLSLIAGPVAMAVLAVVLVLVATGGAGPIPSAAAAQSVRHAVEATFRSNAVGLHLSASVSVEGQQIDLTGNGGCILSIPECSFTLTDNESIGAGTVGTLEEIATGTAIYLKFPPSIAQHLPKPWVEAPFPLTRLKHASGTSVGENPLSGFAALARDGAAVTKLGPATVNGVATTQYQVQLGSTALHNELGKISSDLPAWMRAKDTGAAFAGATADVYVGRNGKLVRTSISENVTTSGISESITLTETITSYHAHVVVTAPPSKDVMSITQLQQLGSGGSIG